MGKIRILIADDEKDGRNLTKAILRQADYITYEAADGEEAVRRIREEIPDLILLDVQMPKMDGYQVCYEIRNTPELKNIPVILLTSLDDTIDKIRGLHMGIDDYVTKPFEVEELLARINAVLSRRKFYEEISMTDGITGLYNLQFFKNQIQIFFNMAKRHEQIFTLAVVDVNDFKYINDTYGHSNGDLVLKGIANVLTDTLRKSDIITRYGGDEFAIILPNLDLNQAEIAMNKVKKRLAEEEFRPEKGIKFKVSVSIGLAVWNESYSNEEQLFKSADNSMYQDKERHKKNKKGA